MAGRVEELTTNYFNGVADQYKFPTTPSIAATCRDFFLQRSPELTYAEEKRLIESQILRGIYGFDALASFALNTASLSALVRRFHSPENPLVVIRSLREDTGVLINTFSAKRVIRQYPDFFPEDAQTHSGLWVFQNMNNMNATQNGLLSGLPLESVLKYPLWESAVQRDFLSGRDDYSYSASLHELRRNGISLEAFTQMTIAHLSSRFSEDEILALVAVGRIAAEGRRNVVEGIIFTDADAEYCRRATKFFLFLTESEDAEIPALTYSL